MDDLNILPPDKDVFHDKKPVSNKQKEHLARARQAAKETIERRRKLEAEAKKEAEKEKEPEQQEEEEEEEIPEPPVVKRQPRKTTKKNTDLSEDEIDLRRFEKFMKNMKTYEDLKVQNIKDLEESKKVKVSLSQEEYDHMLALLDKENKATEIIKANPAEQKKPDPLDKPLVRNFRNDHNRDPYGRFGY